jgi:hypothetical protein
MATVKGERAVTTIRSGIIWSGALRKVIHHDEFPGGKSDRKNIPVSGRSFQINATVSEIMF